MLSRLVTCLALLSCAHGSSSEPRARPTIPIENALQCESRCDGWAIDYGMLAVFIYERGVCCCAAVPAPESRAPLVRECFDERGRTIAPLTLAAEKVR